MGRIVEAVGVSANAKLPRDRTLSQRIEAAMSQAVRDCYAEGITDPAVIRERMLAAREAAKERPREG